MNLTRRVAIASTAAAALRAADGPMRIAIAGLEHGHAAGLFRRIQGREDVAVIGIAEPNRPVAERYAKQFNLASNLFHDRLEAMLDAVKPEAVMAFTDTFGHKGVVEACGPRKIPVMVEKPLAVSMEHATAIERAAARHGIPVLVNYETTWYPSVHRVKSMVGAGAIGAITKIVVRDGHAGPKAIGVQPEFFAWLTNPVRNGAGALFDFGCYGANLAAWLFDNRLPGSVTALTQQLQPSVYPQVDDEATILLNYPAAQVIVQGSWNWPYSRKDMDVYGRDGYVLAPDRNTVRSRSGKQLEETSTAPALPAEEGDEVSYLISVVRSKRKPDGLSSLENNMAVMRILSAARDSAQSGRTIQL